MSVRVQPQAQFPLYSEIESHHNSRNRSTHNIEFPATPRRTKVYRLFVTSNPMKTLHPQCPVCSETIVLQDPYLDHVDCPHCHVRFAGIELFDSLQSSAPSNPDRILPYGVMVGETLNMDILHRLLHNIERVFELVVAGNEPGNLYSEHDLSAYLVSLVEGQQGDREEFMPGSWALERKGRMSKDLHQELVHLPTFLALGTLSFTLREKPSLTRGIAALKVSLQRGLDFASGQGLAGPGYEWLDWRVRILTIFDKGKVLDLLRESPELSLHMCYVLGYIHQRTSEILASAAGPIQYQTRAPVSRDIYERIAALTAPFDRYCHGESTALTPTAL